MGNSFRKCVAVGYVTAALLLTGGCSGGTDKSTSQPSPTVNTPATKQQTPTPADAQTAHLHNLHRLTDRIYSGAQPENDADFAAIATLGAKTIISVDGMKPDVACARQHGLRYIHIPFGYDGVPEQAKLALVRALRDTTGPVYFHCHHGKHRGPAAAAVAAIASGSIDQKRGLAFLTEAGTSKDYAGLWKDVQQCSAPAADAQLPELVETVDVGPLATAMSRIDRLCDALEASGKAGWQEPPPAGNDSFAGQALQMTELFREAARTMSDDYDNNFKKRLERAAAMTAALEQLLKKPDFPGATRQIADLRQDCKTCHAEYRD